jgi:outer membrane protein OmpA-like peptidoglycan-associated protein
MRKEFETSKKMSAEYRSLLTSAQTIFGKEVLPTLEVDAHGLLLDCRFVGLPGQIAFFEDKGNLSGFANKMKDALDLAVDWQYAKTKNGFDPPELDYKKLAALAGVPYEAPKNVGGIIAEDFNIESDALENNVIVSFTINFEPNQSEFLASQYGAEFRRAIQAASTFGNAVIEIRGHADPYKALRELVRSGMKKGLIKRTGSKNNYRYFLQGKPMDLTQTDKIVKLIEIGAFESDEIQPKRTVQSALNLSKARANAVKQSLVDYAKQQGSNLDVSQIQPTGAGVTEPIVPLPTSNADAKENRRVEFRIIRVPAEELIDDSDFDI